MHPSERRPTAFFLFRDSSLRREALRLPPGAVERYSLYGLDQLQAGGFDVSHNLESGSAPGKLARAGGRVLRLLVAVLGGYAGDFATVLACRRRLNRADVIFSTVDTVGIPLVLLARMGLVRTPIVYAAIGLPERLDQIRRPLARRFYRSAYRRLDTIVAYGTGEADALRSWLGTPRVVFVPFGVDTDYFRPARQRRPPAVDIVSVGADPKRDYALLLELARRRPAWSFWVVASRDHAAALRAVPATVEVRYDVSLADVREALRTARVVVLPVRANTYTGATTVLLQALSCGKPVVVSRTAAIADGYSLETGVNCVLVTPGDLDALEAVVATVLDDGELAAALGARARSTAERLTWARYAGTIGDLLFAACRTAKPVINPVVASHHKEPLE
jgi:glycosyltransferase involved in cell wall biosynthesis